MLSAWAQHSLHLKLIRYISQGNTRGHCDGIFFFFFLHFKLITCACQITCSWTVDEKQINYKLLVSEDLCLSSGEPLRSPIGGKPSLGGVLGWSTCATLSKLPATDDGGIWLPRIDVSERPSLVLAAEQQLGITAGLQDRVIQVALRPSGFFIPSFLTVNLFLMY
jgi:hypothetical protein